MATCFNSCTFCGVESTVPLVISMTLNKTESLRLHSNNDISSQFRVNIMPKRKRDRISDPAKTSNLCRHASFVWRPYVIRSFYSSESSQWHITAYMRDTRHTSPPLRPDPNNSPLWSGKYRVSSPVLFALYWQSNSSRRWYKTAITNTTTASLHP